MRTHTYQLLLVFFLACTLYLFLEFVEELKNFRTEEKRVDAIVVLTGGTGRADYREGGPGA
jgi:hypothetical protein